jgi:hypothetical protein
MNVTRRTGGAQMSTAAVKHSRALLYPDNSELSTPTLQSRLGTYPQNKECHRNLGTVIRQSTPWSPATGVLSGQLSLKWRLLSGITPTRASTASYTILHRVTDRLE